MADELIDRVFQRSRDHAPSHRFGLGDAQCVADSFVHNGRWFNRQGQLLGYGDLSKQNLSTIADELKDGELFLVMREFDFCIDIKNRKDTYDWESLLANERQQYVYDYATFLVAPGKVYEMGGFAQDGTTRTARGGLIIQHMSRKRFMQTIKSA